MPSLSGTVTSVKLSVEIGLHGTEQRQILGAGHKLETAVLLVARVQRHPRGHAGARLHAQIVLILVQGLATRAGRLEVEHGLHGKGFDAGQRRQPLVDALIEQPLERQIVPAMHLHHARVALERIDGPGEVVDIDAGRIAGVFAGLAQCRVMVSIASRFFRREKPSGNHVTVLVELFDRCWVDHRCPQE